MSLFFERIDRAEGRDRTASEPVGRRTTGPDGASRQQRWAGNGGAPRNQADRPFGDNGRLYSGHALDRMQERGLVPSVVENTIQDAFLVGSEDGVSTYFDGDNGVTAIVDNETGNVITAY